ncbi:zinc-binding dehydrogenase [Rhodococcus wratislaviensis]|uniref:zinc-binding dehydrogenase n=1 Tax=Rhodococcus wratislaviensis TaxID=44752 RepID=UPI003646BB1B
MDNNNIRSWQYVGAGEKLTLNRVPSPTPAAGEVVVDVKASGLCHTMVGILDGSLSFLVPAIPQTLGDELAGCVVAVGADVDGVKIGDRVANAAIGPETAGVGRDGGFAEMVAVRADRVVHIPDAVSFSAAAVATDAGATSYSAVHIDGRVQPGDRVGIIGYGGLGSIAAQIALSAGAKVLIAETNAEARQQARSGGRYTVVDDVLQFADHRLNVIMDFAGAGSTTAGAIEVIEPYGRIVQVGTGKPTAEINIPLLIAKHLTITGSSVDSPDALRKVLDLIADDKLTLNLTEISFDEIGDGIARLERGEARGRQVAVQP